MSCQYQELTRLSVRQDSGRSLRQDWLAAACAVPDAPNHFHMVVETPRGNLVAGMKWFWGTYCGRFNRRHKLFGHLFSGRYKALLIDSRNSLTNSCGRNREMTVVPERITSKGISFWWVRGIEQATGCRLRKRKWRNKVLPSRHFGVPLSMPEDDPGIEISRIGRCV